MEHITEDENKDKPIPEIQGIAKNSSVEIYPQLFNIVGVQHGTQKIILYTRAHFTKEEAIEAFKQKVALKTGTPADLWLVKVISSISAADLEKEFIDIQDQVKAEKAKAKNALMRQIIGDKDVNLLHRHYNRFTNAEIQYMHEAIL